MKRPIYTIALPLAFILAVLGGLYLYRRMQPPAASPARELQVYLPDKAAPGFTLIPRDGMAEVHLVDMLGRLVHKWSIDATRARLLPDGHLLVVHGSKWGSRQPQWARLRRFVHEYDWDGNLVWEYRAADIAHHDVQRLANGNTLFLRRVMVPKEERAAKVRDPVLSAQQIRSDAIVEVNRAGEIVWEWGAEQHLDLNSCGYKNCVISRSPAALKNFRDWTHMNTVVEIPENQWYAQGHSAFRPGNIMTVARNWWTAFIIDKQTKEIVWQYTGGDYKGGISGIHEAQLVAPGLPGAGNLLLFDNGHATHPGMSFVLEINPITLKREWIYDAGRQFVSAARGSQQRFANGNTLISEDNRGRCFEVTGQGEVVWQYKSKANIDRCHRYPLDYAPQFKGLEPLPAAR